MLSKSNLLTYSGTTALLLLSLFSTAHATPTNIATTPLLYQLPPSYLQQCNRLNRCPEIDIRYLASDHAWVNAWVNQLINQRLLDDARPIKTLPTPAQQVALQLLVKDALDEALSVDDDLDDEDWADEDMLTRLRMVPRQVGEGQRYKSFVLDTQMWFNAVKMRGSEYLMLDTQTRQPIGLTEILLSSSAVQSVSPEDQLFQLMYVQLQHWLQQPTSVKDTEAAELMRLMKENLSQMPMQEFELSENVALTATGLQMEFMSWYPDVDGMELLLTVPYDQLHGVIKPEYLPR